MSQTYDGYVSGTNATDSTTEGDYFEIFVANFGSDIPTGASSQVSKLSSYLRIGAADTSAGDANRAKMYGDDLAREAIQYNDNGTIARVFVDDDRKRNDDNSEPDDGFVSKADRLTESRKIFSRGGWRDHSDGNRISTTRGDKLEVVRGNYRMLVLGRQDDADYACEDDKSGGLHHNEDRHFGERSLSWTKEQDGTWKITDTTTAGEIEVTYEGHTKQTHNGKYEEYFRDGDYTSEVGNYAGVAGGGVDKIYDGMYATEIEEIQQANAAITRKYGAPIIMEAWAAVYFEFFFGNRLSFTAGFEELISIGLSLSIRLPYWPGNMGLFELVVGDFYEFATDRHLTINTEVVDVAFRKKEMIITTDAVAVKQVSAFATGDELCLAKGIKGLFVNLGA